MKSRTPYAVLGMLQAGPCSGYDLKRRFEERVQHFWSESSGQIYPALARLDELGWVSGRRQAGRGRPDRTVYRITSQGRAALREWMKEEPGPDRVRNELLLKIFLGTAASPETLREHVERYEAHLRELAVSYEGYAALIEELATSPEEQELWKLTLLSGELVNQARATWCRAARRTLSRLEKSGKAARR